MSDCEKAINEIITLSYSELKTHKFSEETEKHIAKCEKCRNEYEKLLKMQQAVKETFAMPEKYKSTLYKDVEAKIGGKTNGSKRKRFYFPIGTAAAAAVIALVMISSYGKNLSGVLFSGIENEKSENSVCDNEELNHAVKNDSDEKYYIISGNGQNEKVSSYDSSADDFDSSDLGIRSSLKTARPLTYDTADETQKNDGNENYEQAKDASENFAYDGQNNSSDKDAFDNSANGSAGNDGELSDTNYKNDDASQNREDKENIWYAPAGGENGVSENEKLREDINEYIYKFVNSGEKSANEIYTELNSVLGFDFPSDLKNSVSDSEFIRWVKSLDSFADEYNEENFKKFFEIKN